MTTRLNNSSATAAATAAAAANVAVNTITNGNNVSASANAVPPSTSNNNNSSSSSAVNNNSSSNSNSNSNNTVGLHYKIGKKIGEGSFGVIFEGTNLINQLPVAIKFEPRKTEAPQLRDEYRTYKHLNGSYGIPHAYYFGQEGIHNILVIDLLGPSLEDLFDWCGRKFSVKTTVQVAVQMISLIETLHNRDLIYRDIKPDNFLIGRPGQADENQIHLVDFGMAKQYRDPRTKQHIPYREKKSLSGTARYMSINTHLGREQSRRDDLEALGHVFFYFLRGQLPWQGLKAPTNKQKYEKIGEKKRTTPVTDLAIGLPHQFATYLETVRNLGFEETPNYESYRQLLISVLTDIGETMDGEYDWMKLNGGKGWDLAINKKPNLHGYGHPNPPNEKDRHHRNQRRKQHQHQQQQQQMFANGQLQNPSNAQGNNTQLPPQSLPPSTPQQNRSNSNLRLNATGNALNQQQYNNKQPAPIRSLQQQNTDINTSSQHNNNNQNHSNQLQNDNESAKKGFFAKLLCCT